jgi:hypothetical protein
MWKWVSKHGRRIHYEPQGFLNFGAQVSKVIIFIKFTGKLHLPLFFLSLTNIIIQFIINIVVLGFVIIILSTLTIITTSFPFVPSWLLVTIWV